MDGKKEENFDWLGVYPYRRDGTYSRVKWIRGPAQLMEILPKIRKHVSRKLEVAITNGGDEIVFQSLNGVIVWDGLGFAQVMPGVEVLESSS